MSRQSAMWYLRRIRRMSAAEIAWRGHDQIVRTVWARQQVRPGDVPGEACRKALLADREFTAVLPADAADRIPADVAMALIDTADSILAGEAEVLGFDRTDLAAPDWFADPITGRRSDPGQYAFRINHRAQEQVGNVKQVWELSRHHHLTRLAAAWHLTRNDKYAERTATQLQSWWRANPFLSGIHWTSGIELGIRLISWVWIRRLLSTWPHVGDVFENNELALRQIYWHQRYLARLRSRGSSSNNHVIAEAAGQLVASCAFPWFTQSRRWGAGARRLLERELAANTYPSGVNRELATDYHRFVAELSVLAAVEADAAEAPLSYGTWALITRVMDASAALVDSLQRPPRQGDDDEGRVLTLDARARNDWSGHLALGASVVPRLPWWPATSPDVTSTTVAALARPHDVTVARPAHRPFHFPDAGITLLRTADDLPEIWCRCDGGPHGFLAIAAHAHCDALSIEVRVAGVDVLADPGTYCYHGDREWRDYFRSTIAHNTVQLAGREQSRAGGPFLWLSHADARALNASSTTWSGEHHGYSTLDRPAVHRRSVELNPAGRTLRVVDRVDSVTGHDAKVAFHLGPSVRARLEGTTATLEWPGGRAVATLPSSLVWTAHRGETDPILGWYSGGFGHKQPTTTLLGTGRIEPGRSTTSTFSFKTARHTR